MLCMRRINLWGKKQTHDQINLEEQVSKFLGWYVRMFLIGNMWNTHILCSWCGSHFSRIATSSLPHSIYIPREGGKRGAPTFHPKSILCSLNVWNWGGISMASMQKCARKLSLIGGQGYQRCVCKGKGKCKDTL